MAILRLRLTGVILLTPGLFAQPPAPAPKFEVSSVRLCKDAAIAGERGGGGNSSPGRLAVSCTTVKGLINQAYLLFADGRFRIGLPPPIEGGPGWINSERYEINAKAEGDPSLGIMHGPMLQALLEDRFKLKVHHETREVPVYELTVAKGGPRLPAFQPGTCTPVDRTRFAPFSPPLTTDQISKNCHARGMRDGANRKVEAEGMSVGEFAKLFLDSHTLDRPVVDKTGLTGLFDFHLEYAPDGAASPGGLAPGPSIFTALEEQLGLKLVPAKGPGEFLVIDHVERPSAN